ncbi:asparagine synthase (glutamine-hydrolyzing) [Mycobacterium fragae]|nr:asparagine synthase (glutamine-hydrolyzing) [Mycobacterium fragae]
MCGIVACMALNPTATVPSLDVGAATLTHRGPEGQKAWTSPCGRVTLAHTRLSIIDLITGDQPIPNEDRSVWAVVNGEFYGYQAIRNDLELVGHKFKTKSDSEILLHLYEDRGTSAVHWLNGEYAFVLWDHNNRELVACRDRFGIKPLCYAIFDGKLFVASEAKALFALGVPADLDSESVYQYLHVSQDPDRTFFSHVRQIPPGHYLLVRNGTIRLISYWDHDLDSIAEPLDENAVVKEFESRLSEAVRLRLIADVPVGVYLSGGIDSSATYALACQHTSRPPHAFTVCFDDTEYNEETDATALAKHFGGDIDLVRLNRDNIADYFRTAIWHAEMPSHNGHIVAKYLLSRRVRERNMKVVLSGQGADEVLAGYAHFISDFHNLRSTPDGRSLAEVSSVHATSRGLHLPVGEMADISAIQRTFGFVPTWLSARAATATRLRSLCAPAFMAQFDTYDPYRIFLNNFPLVKPNMRADLRYSSYLWNKSIFLHYMLGAFDDKMDMANSVEARNPYLDPSVAPYAFGLPDDLKIRDVKSKYVLREAVKRLVPAGNYGNLKRPFFAPPLGGSNPGRFTELLQDTLRGSEAKACEYLDSEALRRTLDKVPQMTAEELTLWSPVLTIALSLTFLSSFSAVDYSCTGSSLCPT